MAYSAWRWERQMSLQEKKKAWGVLEAFPSFKTKMRLKEKFSIRLIRRTYKWLIKVNDAIKDKGQVTITDVMQLMPEGCAIFLEDAFDIASVHPDHDTYQRREKALKIVLTDDTTTESQRSSSPKSAKEEDYFSCSSVVTSDEEEEDEDEDVESVKNSKEMKELMELMGSIGKQSNIGKGAEASRRMSSSAELGQVFGGMLNGMMTGLVDGVLGKDKALYKMYCDKYGKLKHYVETNEDSIPSELLDDYEKMIKILKGLIKAYDDHEENPLLLTTYIDKANKKLQAIDTPYPAKEVNFNEEDYGEAMTNEMFSENGIKESECSVM